MMKRLFDIFFSLTILILLLPLFILIAAAIKLQSKGPIFHVQKRLKKNFHLFSCIKFRTMYIDADEKLEQLLENNKAFAQEWHIYRKLKNDPRITKIGKFLRKTSLDELPQFFNVLKGDLSVVGPRPFLTQELTTLTEKGDIILSIKPGITGIWQTSGRNALSLEKRLLLDEKYIKKQSFVFDLILIGKTIIQVIFPKGAY